MRTTPKLIVASALLLAGCEPARVPEISIAISPWPGYEFLHLAIQQGLIDSSRVRIRTVELNSLADARRAYERGQVDGFTSTLIEAIQVLDHGDRSPRIVYVTDFSNGADVIVGTRRTPSVRQLRGRRVGIEPGTLNLYLLARALETVQMTLADLTTVPFPATDLSAALDSGLVDAVVTYPPYSIETMGKPGRAILFSSAAIPGEILDVISLDSSVIARHPEAPGVIARGFEAARVWAADHPEEAIGIMARREQITPEEFRQVLDGGIRVLGFEEQAEYFIGPTHLRQLLIRTRDLLAAAGEVAAGLEVESVFDTTGIIRPAGNR